MGKVQAESDPLKAGTGAKARLPRPGECRNLMRERLAKEFDGIMDGFIAAAKKGSCPHVKLATELLREGESRAKAKKGSARLLMEKLDREEAERARLEREGKGLEGSPAGKL